MSHGPYCRLESSSQTREDAARQAETGEVWGRAHKQDARFLCVKAYPRKLKAGERGIGFTTLVAHDPHFSAPHEARWYYLHTPGVLRRTNAHGEDVAAIPARVTNRQA
jgi:hypothetical protein